MLHVGIRQFAKAEGVHSEVGVGEQVQPRDVGLVVRVDDACRILREQHGAFETVALAQQLPEHWHRFLRSILLVARQENDVFAVGLPGGRFVDDPMGGVAILAQTT